MFACTSAVLRFVWDALVAIGGSRLCVRSRRSCWGMGNNTVAFLPEPTMRVYESHTVHLTAVPIPRYLSIYLARNSYRQSCSQSYGLLYARRSTRVQLVRAPVPVRKAFARTASPGAWWSSVVNITAAAAPDTRPAPVPAAITHSRLLQVEVVRSCRCTDVRPGHARVIDRTSWGAKPRTTHTGPMSPRESAAPRLSSLTPLHAVELRAITKSYPEGGPPLTCCGRLSVGRDSAELRRLLSPRPPAVGDAAADRARGRAATRQAACDEVGGGGGPAASSVAATTYSGTTACPVGLAVDAQLPELLDARLVCRREHLQPVLDERVRTVG